MNSTLLGLSTEIRLQIYPLVFDESMFKICGNKFRRGHHRDDLPDRGKRISTRQIYYGPAHVCRQLRCESLPFLLDRATLCCCHMGLRLIKDYCLSLYRKHFRRVSVDIQSFDPRYVRFLRPNVLPRLCKEPLVFLKLQTLIIRAGPCLKLARGTQRDRLQSTTLTATGKTAFEMARDRTGQQLLGGGNGTLARISGPQDRTFKVEIHTYLADFHPQDEEGRRGVAAVSPALCIPSLRLC